MAQGNGKLALSLMAAMLLWVAMPGGVQGQQDPAEYKRQLDAAAEIIKAGDLPASLLAYLEIRSKFSGPEVDYSLGRVYQRLHQCDEAKLFYLFVMNSYNLDEGSQLFTRSANYFNDLFDCDGWSQVEVRCSPADATLFIDGESVGPCFSRPYRLPGGEHVFRLEAKGEAPVEKRLSVKDGERKKVELVIETAKVEERIVEVPVEVAVGGGSTSWLGWGLISGGAAVLVASGYFSAMGYSALGDVQRAADRGDVQGRKSAEDEVSTAKILTGVSLGVGAACVATGLVFVLLDAFGSGESDSGGVALGVQPEGASLLWRTTF